MIVKNVLNTYIMGIGWFPVPLHVFEVDTRENFEFSKKECDFWKSKFFSMTLYVKGDPPNRIKESKNN